MQEIKSHKIHTFHQNEKKYINHNSILCKTDKIKVIQNWKQ